MQPHLRELHAELKRAQLTLEITDRLVGRGIGVAIAALGMDTEKTYTLDAGCTSFTVKESE